MDPKFFFATGFLPMWILVPLTIATAFSMARTQPLQTVLSGMVVMYILCAAQFLLIDTKANHRWAEPLLSVVAIVNSRGVGKLILRRWRETPYYGYWLIGIATVLTVLVLMPWSSVVVWGDILITAAVITVAQFLCVPWLIEKRPNVPPPSYCALLLWLAIGLVPLCAKLKI